MSVVDSPIVRMGNVLNFTVLGGGGNHLELKAKESDEFAEFLAKNGSSLIRENLKKEKQLDISDNQEEKFSSEKPQVFPGKLKVVRFSDLTAQFKKHKLNIGMSATVCEGEKKSKVWVRVSLGDTKSDNEVKLEGLFDVMREFAYDVCELLNKTYKKCMEAFLEEKEMYQSAKLNLKIEHTFLLEAGDYSSAKLFDTITTLRETKSFLSVYGEEGWSPLKSLLEFTKTRFTDKNAVPMLESGDMKDLNNEHVEKVTEFFNSEYKALIWDVRSRCHGLFAVDERGNDLRTNSPKTHMVGICSNHLQIDPKITKCSSAWLISGNYASVLGEAF